MDIFNNHGRLRVLTVVLLALVSTAASAEQPVFNGRSGSVSFEKYVLVAEISVKSDVLHIQDPVPGGVVTVSFIHTYDPEFGLIVASWPGKRLAHGAKTGKIADCKYGDMQTEQFANLRQASARNVLIGMSGQPTSGSSVNIEFSKAVYRFSENIGDIPVIWCSPLFEGK